MLMSRFLANDEPVSIEILRKSLDALRVENERLRNEKVGKILRW